MGCWTGWPRRFVSRRPEQQIIAELLRPLADAAGLKFQDDAAILPTAIGHQSVVTKDMMVQGRHFLDDDPAQDVAAKLLAVNLSDLAAMGATPAYVFLGLALPSPMDDPWLANFVAGLETALKAASVGLAGGDLTGGVDRRILSLTAIGHVPDGKAILRSGAKPGDRVFVSGTMGDAYLGLKALLGEVEATPYWIERYRRPSARTALGQLLSGHAHAAADVSDGLMIDVASIAQASNVAIDIWLDQIPFSAPTKAWASEDLARLKQLVTGGDDYELIFTGPETLARRVKGQAVPIGHVKHGSGVKLLDRSDKPVQMDYLGFGHE